MWITSFPKSVLQRSFSGSGGGFQLLSLTSELGVGCTTFASVARVPRRVASGLGTRDITLPAGLPRATGLTIVSTSAYIFSTFVWNASFSHCMPCWVLKSLPSFVKALWSTIFSAFWTSINRSSLGLSAIRFLTIVFQQIKFPFIKSAIGEPASGFRGMVHKATILGQYLSFNSLRRQINKDSHFASGVTGFLEMSFVPIIKVSVSTQSLFCSSIILIT